MYISVFCDSFSLFVVLFDLIIIFLRESLSKIKKDESRIIKIKKKYEKSISLEKFKSLMEDQEREDEKKKKKNF